MAESNLEIEDKIAWVTQAIRERPDADIVWRMYASILREDDTADITEAAWELIRRDDVFDCTYEVGRPGTVMGLWKNKPLMVALHWLKKQNLADIPVDSRLWEAAMAYEAKGNKYDGALHFEYAQAIAADDPVSAYTHAANAVAYLYRSKHKVCAEAIGLAHELAKSQGWQELETVLRWSLDEMRSALQRRKRR